MNEKVFREYDIRGVIGKDIDRDFAFSLGRAFSLYIKKRVSGKVSLSVGRDVRLSSEYLFESLTEGIISTGTNVYDIGVCPTPLQYFSLFTLDVDGGVMITGSHNPPEYNGFKLSIGKDTIHGKMIQEIKEIMQKDKTHFSSRKGTVKTADIVSSYSNYMLKKFSYLADSKYRKIKIVVDAGNGTAGLVVPKLLEAIGCDVYCLYCEPDGRFPNHHPDPTIIENIQDLIAKTTSSGAQIGVGYDGDADRIGVIDQSGNIVWGDHLMIILARDLLKRNPGAKIIGDVKCSQFMFDEIKRNGGIPVMWKTGHSLIKDKMRKEGALLAGEFSGHIFIADGYFGFDDAIYTTLRIVEIMKTTGMDIRELLKDIPPMCYTPEIRVDCPEEKKKLVVEKVVNKFKIYKLNNDAPFLIKDIYNIDGVRVVFEKGWALLRASNTQPVVVIRAEAEDEKSLIQYKEFIEREFKKAMETL
jgi:phosphomannomutase/phosphoglucomutase